MTKERILLVDDEPNVLSGYRRGLRNQFEVTTAEGGPEALTLLDTTLPFAVVVSDMRMPQMNGVELLKRIKAAAPETVRIMLTGNADQETAIQAVNQGHIFRFLNKPCPPETLGITLAMAVRQHHLIIAEKELLEKTLKGSVAVLTEILSLTDPDAFRLANDVRDYFTCIQSALEIESSWELEMATLLSPIGLLTLPPELKAKVTNHTPLSDEEEQAVRSIPEIGARLLSRIPRLEQVAQLVRCGVDRERAPSCTAKLSDGLSSGLGAIRLLFALVSQQQSGRTTAHAFEWLYQQDRHDPKLVARVHEALRQRKPELFDGDYLVLDLTLRHVSIGDELFTDMTSKDKRLLLAAGSRITGPFLERLFNYQRIVGINEPIRVKRFVTTVASGGLPNDERIDV